VLILPLSECNVPLCGFSRLWSFVEFREPVGGETWGSGLCYAVGERGVFRQDRVPSLTDFLGREMGHEFLREASTLWLHRVP
jgi:hypothetical protein